MDEIKASKQIPANSPDVGTPPSGVRWFRNSTMRNVAPMAPMLCFGPTWKTARRSYSRDLRHAMNEDDVGEDVGMLPWWTRDRELKFENGPAHVDILGRSTGLERPRLEAKEFVTMAGEILVAEVDQLASRRQDTDTAKLRRNVASRGIERWGQRAGK